MIFKSDQQPLCRSCGKPIARYTEVRYVWDRQPKFNTDSIIVVPEGLHSKADCQRYSNKIVTAVGYSYDTDVNYERTGSRRVDKFYEWDGESYQDEFFCTNACAHDFARMAARSGTRSQAYVNALNRQQRKK